MNSSEDLMNHLKSNIELHRIVLHTCVDDDDDNMQIIQALERHIVGIKMKVYGMISAQKEDLVKCVRQKIEEHPNIDELDDKDESEESEEDCDIEMRERSQMKGFDYWDAGAIILYASLGVVAVIFIAGSVWDIRRSHDPENREEGTL